MKLLLLKVFIYISCLCDPLFNCYYYCLYLEIFKNHNIILNENDKNATKNQKSKNTRK
jgi:hypothetical protein